MAPIAASSRLGIIGAGQRLRSILKLLLEQAPGLSISAVYDPDARSVKSLVDDVASAASICDSPEALCKREDLDWVMIGSWNSQHAAQAILALKSGKHVFCEKPLALNLDEARQMQEAWEQSGKVFSLGLVLRYSPLYRAAKDAIISGKIGKILSFEFNETLDFNHGGYIHSGWRRLTEHAGSHLLEKCCHDIDLALWLVDDVPVRVASFGGLSFFTPEHAHHQDRIGPNVKGRPAFQGWDLEHLENPFLAQKDIVDHQVAILEFSRGAKATFHTHCAAALRERRFYIIGSEGALRMDAYTGVLELVRMGWNDAVETLHPIEGDGHAGADIPMCRELAACMAGQQKPAAGIAEGITSLRVVQAIDQAMLEQRVVQLLSPT